ncbi:MAG: TetR family transcriptional regulator, partial [Emcibacter sp.]|nr:TetR family transcriptional regulator [Emcibacter sp.]
RQFDHMIRAVIKEGIEDGTIRPFRPETITAMLFGIFNIIPRWYQEDGPIELDDISNQIFDVLSYGVSCDSRVMDIETNGQVRNPLITIARPDGLDGVKNQYDRIIREAAIKFADQDFDATSLSQIAKAVGISKPTLYHYIKSKDELLYLCLQQSFQNIDEAIIILQDKNIPAFKRLQIFHDLLLHAQNNIYGRCVNLISPQALERSSSGSIREFQLRLDGALRAIYADGIEAGDFREMPSIILTTIVFGASNWVPRWFKANQKGGLQYVIDTFYDVLVHGFATSKGRPHN